MKLKNYVITALGGITVEEHNATLSMYDEEFEKIMTEVARLRTFIDEKHMSLSNFKEYLDKNLKQVDIRYDMGYGYKQRVNTILKIDKDTEQLYRDFAKQIMLKGYYSDADELVYDIKVGLNRFVNGKYNTEKKAWGKNGEYWARPSELYDKYVTQKSAGDCDDRGLFEFQVIKSALKKFGLWEENKWRLRCIIVNIIGAERHFLLAWVKGRKLNDWLAVESTYAPELFDSIWYNDIAISKNWLYRIDYSFDESGAYRRL